MERHVRNYATRYDRQNRLRSFYTWGMNISAIQPTINSRTSVVYNCGGLPATTKPSRTSPRAWNESKPKNGLTKPCGPTAKPPLTAPAAKTNPTPKSPRPLRGNKIRAFSETKQFATGWLWFPSTATNHGRVKVAIFERRAGKPTRPKLWGVNSPHIIRTLLETTRFVLENILTRDFSRAILT